MNLKLDVGELNNILNDFSNVCGININVVNKYFSAIGDSSKVRNDYCQTIQKSNLGRDMCICSDIELYKKCQESKKAESHICHAGLLDIAVPIIWNEEVLGYIIFGQIKTDNDFNKVNKYISNLPVDKKELEYYYNKLPLLDDEKINSVANIATMISKYILFENIFKPEINTVVDKAIKFMEKNYQSNLSVQDIVDSTGISKSSLYKNFSTHYKCTPGEYLNKLRVEKSIEYLLFSDFPIEEISLQVGFSSASYYSKIFKKIKGISPLKFKKIQAN